MSPRPSVWRALVVAVVVAGAVALVAALVLGACSGADECAPTDYGGGYECGPEPGTFTSCNFTMCIEGPFCSRDRYVIREGRCPAAAPTCRDADAGQIVCVGDSLGPCKKGDVFYCEDAVTMVSCLADEHGALYWSRGPCPIGSTCVERDAGDIFGPQGCTP